MAVLVAVVFDLDDTLIDRERLALAAGSLWECGNRSWVE